MTTSTAANSFMAIESLLNSAVRSWVEMSTATNVAAIMTTAAAAAKTTAFPKSYKTRARLADAVVAVVVEQMTAECGPATVRQLAPGLAL